MPSVSRTPAANSVVLRPSWHHRHLSRYLSPPLLKDLLLNTTLPPPFFSLQISLLEQPLTLTVLSITPSNSLILSTTSLHLVPALPPSLVCPAPRNLQFHSLGLAIAPPPLFKATYLPAPRLFLSDTEQKFALAWTVRELGATLIYVRASDLLRNAASVQGGVYRPLEAYFKAAAAIGKAVVMLDDAHLVFPDNDEKGACAFVAALHLVVGHVAVVLCIGKGRLHKEVRKRVDVVLGGEEEGDRLIGDMSLVHVVDDGWVSGDACFEELENRWSEFEGKLGGVSEAREVLKRVLLWRRTRQKEFEKVGVWPACGALLYGAPGTGKTALMRGTACAAGFGVVRVDAALVARGEVGEGEKVLRAAFRKADEFEWGVVFLDEIDALVGMRGVGGRLGAVLGGLMDGLEGGGVVVVGATNRPWRVEKGLLRAGRFEYCVKVGLPGVQGRREIGRIYGDIMGMEKGCVEELAGRAEGLSGADIAGACRRAVMRACCKGETVGKEDLVTAFLGVRASVQKEEGHRIEEWLPPG